MQAPKAFWIIVIVESPLFARYATNNFEKSRMGYVLLQRKKGSLKKNNFVLFSYKKSTILSLACSTRVDYILSISKNITVAGDNFAGAGQT